MITSTAKNISSYEDPRFQNIAFVIVKVTHRCNLDCAYCYEHITAGADMEMSLFRSVISKVIRSTRSQSVRFILHGGEPSLMSAEWLTEAIGFVETESRIFGKVAHVGIQSNILALNERKLKLLKDLRVSVGASMDGPGDIPGAMRPLAARAVEKYRLAESMGVRVGVLMTINNSNWNHFTRIMNWLHTDIKATSCKVNVVTPVGMGRDLPWLSAEQVFKAYKDIVDYMIEAQGEMIEQNMLWEMRRFVAGDRIAANNTLCHKKQCGAGSEVVGITPEGNILPCGRFGWDDSDYFLGAMSDRVDEASTEHYAQAVEQFHRLVPESWYDCDGCAAKAICTYGCQAFIVRSKKKANIDCFPTKMRYEYFKAKAPELQALLKKVRPEVN